jgi:hypothetical protein
LVLVLVEITKGSVIMKISKISVLIPFVFAMCFSLFSMPANAQATRTWVSGVGDDANPCSRTAPCKTFAGAISKTAIAGEINCLDPGGFGALTITKSIAIKCVGVEAGVLVSGTNGFNISAAATDVVYIEGLDFEGLNASPNGIQINTAAQVSIVNCEIRGFTTAGISVVPTAASIVNVIDTIIADNPGEGIFVKPTGAGSVRGVMDRVRVLNSTGDGVFLNGNATTGNIKMSARNSESSNNGANGFGVTSASAVTQLQLDAITATNNTTGLAASGSANAIIRFTRSTVFANGTGANATAPALVQSYMTNSVDGNGSPGTFTTINQE